LIRNRQKITRYKSGQWRRSGSGRKREERRSYTLTRCQTR